jgi:hypothetical protein
LGDGVARHFLALNRDPNAGHGPIRPGSPTTISAHKATSIGCELYAEDMAAMTVAELAEGLKVEAARRGITPEQLLDVLTARLPAPEPATGSAAKRRLAFAGIGAPTSGRSARDADEMLAEGFGRS